MSSFRFAPWYYGGPFARVSSPDRDLPRRDASDVSESARVRTERSGVFDGERVVAPFQDGNGIEDILAAIRLAMGYPDDWDEDERFFYPTIQGLLTIARDRVVEKNDRARGRKSAWLTQALPLIETAATAYARSDYTKGLAALAEAERVIEGAGRAGKRGRIVQLGPGDPTRSSG